MSPLILGAALLEGLSLTLIQGYLPLYLRRALGEPSFLTVALVLAVPALGTMVASNFLGGLSDVSGRLKPMILLGLAGYAAALGVIPAFRHGFGILAYVGLASLFYGTLAPSLKTYATLLRPDRKEHALAWVLMAQSTGWLAGSFGGHALLCGLLLRDQRREPPAVPLVRERRGWIASLAADLASLYENPRLLELCILSFFFVAGNYVTWGFFAVFMVERLDASVRTLRYALAASSALGIVSFLYIGPLIRKFGGRTILAVGVTLYLAMYLGIALARDPIVAGAIYALPLYSLVNVSSNALASEYSSPAQRGGGLGVLSGAYAIATIAGPLAGGLLSDRYGLSVIPWIAFAFLLLAAPIAWQKVLAEKPKTPNGRNAR